MIAHVIVLRAGMNDGESQSASHGSARERKGQPPRSGGFSPGRSLPPIKTPAPRTWLTRPQISPPNEPNSRRLHPQAPRPAAHPAQALPAPPKKIVFSSPGKPDKSGHSRQPSQPPTASFIQTPATLERPRPRRLSGAVARDSNPPGRHRDAGPGRPRSGARSGFRFSRAAVPGSCG